MTFPSSWNSIWQSFPTHNILEFNAFFPQRGLIQTSGLYRNRVGTVCSFNSQWPDSVVPLIRAQLRSDSRLRQEDIGTTPEPLKNMPFSYFLKCKWTSEWKLCGVQPPSAGERHCQDAFTDQRLRLVLIWLVQGHAQVGDPPIWVIYTFIHHSSWIIEPVDWDNSGFQSFLAGLPA